VKPVYKSELLSLDVFDTKKRAHEQSTAIEDVKKNNCRLPAFNRKSLSGSTCHII